MNDADILPDSRAKNVKGRISVKGTSYVPIYCANCGTDGGGVPEEHITFAFYLCNKCAETWGPVAGTYMEPDAVFFEKVKQAQIAEKVPTRDLAEVLSRKYHPLAKLARDAPKGR